MNNIHWINLLEINILLKKETNQICYFEILVFFIEIKLVSVFLQN